MPKLSDIIIDSNLYRGRGIRPWNDLNVVKPHPIETANDDPLNHEQSVSNALANSEQFVSNALANSEQTNEATKDSVSITLAQPLARVLANGEQSVSKALVTRNKIINNETIETLVGNEKKLLLFLFQKCQLLGSLESPAITTDELRNVLKINAVHLRNLIHRLLKKNAIEVCKIKNGRAGWRKFKFSKQIFQNLSLDQTVNNALASREQAVSNALSKPLAESLASPLSSSSNLLKTTTMDTVQQFPVEWQNLDIEPLSQIGFTTNHLSQIATQNKLSPQVVQNSIYAFAFDLKENDKAKSIKGDPINFFMGILRKVGPYVTPSNYESPQDKAMRLYRENMREIEKRRADAEKEAINLAFNDWFSKLTDKQKTEFLPEMFRHNTSSEKLGKSKILEGSARSHFEKEIWPNEKENIINGKV